MEEIMSEKINLLNLNQQELEEFVVSLGMKKFYGKQLFNWLHKKIVRDLNEVTNLSLKDRELLTEKAYIPFSLDSISRAFKTFVRFKSGSPIPINTILFKFVPCFTSLLSIV